MTAKSLIDVYNCFQNEPISIDDFDDYYVDADPGRGKPLYKRLKRRLVNNMDGSLKILFAGHKGCGKSTELIRLQKNIDNDFVVVNFSVVQELDVLNISYIELFITVMEKLFVFVNSEKKLSIDDRYLDNILGWMKTREISDINRNYMGMDIATEIKGSASIPFIAKFFGKFRAAAKSSSSMKEELKQKIEPKLSELILNCNLLINDIKNRLPGINRKGLLIIVEDLDKVPLDKGTEIFHTHSTQLTQLNCHCIYTFPIALLYHIKFKTIQVNYAEAFVLPMIKVFEKAGGPCEEGRRIMWEIVSRRMELSLFEDTEVLTDMIKYSGGCLWDLFLLVKNAADNALDYDREKIGGGDFQAALQSLKTDYEYTIAENKEKNISVDDYFKALADCAKDELKRPKSTDLMMDLRNNLTVLNYNGENWSDVHPVVKDILKDKEIL